MSTQLRKLIELRKTQLINKLLQAGIYKSSEKQLYELSVKRTGERMPSNQSCKQINVNIIKH